MQNGPFKILSSRSAYKNPWIEVREDKVIRPDGKEGVFGVINYGSGVSVVPIDKDKNIYLIKEFYYALERQGLQTPAGGIDEGETPLQAAKKELMEEIGCVSNEWVELGFVDPLTMILNSPAHLFLAKGIEQTGTTEDGIELVKVPFNDAVEMVMKSEITHAPTCVAIFKAKQYLGW